MGCGGSKDASSENPGALKGNKPVLTYFPLFGRAEHIRIAFFVAKIQLEERSVSFADWPALKESKPELFEFGQMPVLEMNGKVYS